MEITIRPILQKDAQAIWELRTMPGVFETILGHPAERLDKAEKMLANLDGNTFMFTAEVCQPGQPPKAVGTISLVISANPRTRHIGGIGMMVHKDYQNQGVGSALMGAAVDMADNWLKLLRLELTVFADNERAIHLYEKMGFVIEGRKRLGAIKHGAYCDELYMARIRQET